MKTWRESIRKISGGRIISIVDESLELVGLRHKKLAIRAITKPRDVS